MRTSRILGVALTIALAVTLGAARVRAQRTVPPPARQPAPAPTRRPDDRPPLDRSRSVFLDDQSGLAGALAPVRATLRDAHLWTIQDRRDRADLVLTLKRAPRGTAPPARGGELEMSIQSAAKPAAPLWRSVGPSPTALASRLKADLAPSFCFVLWCR